MAARISALIAELQTKLLAIYPTITFNLNKQNENGAPPRIVWTPTTVQHQSGEHQTTKPRRILTRKPTIVARCWGADYDATEDIVHNLIVAIYTAAWGSIDFQGEQWLGSDDSNEGYVALVSFAPSVPVEGKVYRSVVPTTLAVDPTGAVSGDGELQGGES